MSEWRKTYQLSIITPTRIAFDGDVIHVRAPGLTGSFGVLAQHISMLAALDIGAIRIDMKSGGKIFATSGGYTEILDDKMTILAETAEEASEIDIDRAFRARDRAMKRLQEKEVGCDLDRARLALLRALNRLQISSMK
jgi:F-type H+-transporting ATPase subunit epsilon